MLDPQTHAVRRDLADVRLAECVFAPHYAAPMPQITLGTVVVRSDRDAASPPIGELVPGAVFEVLDIVGDIAWGLEPSSRLVGYVDRAALGDPL